jgi:phosphoenolpyruvate synthase/pyruvate phosphate dikinase
MLARGSHKARLAEIAINEADWLSIDGGSGAIYLGRRKIVAERPEAELAKIKRWQDQSLASAVGSKSGRRATPVETLHPDQA